MLSLLKRMSGIDRNKYSDEDQTRLNCIINLYQEHIDEEESDSFKLDRKTPEIEADPTQFYQVNWIRKVGRGFLSHSVPDLIGIISQYQILRDKNLRTVARRLISNPYSDPLNLFLEELKIFFIEASKVEASPDLLTNVEKRIRYIDAARDAYYNYGSERKPLFALEVNSLLDSETRENLDIRQLLGSIVTILRKSIEPDLKLALSKRSARESIGDLTSHLKLAFSHAIQFLHYSFSANSLIENFTIFDFISPQFKITKNGRETINNKFIACLLKQPSARRMFSVSNITTDGYAIDDSLQIIEDNLPNQQLEMNTNFFNFNTGQFTVPESIFSIPGLNHQNWVNHKDSGIYKRLGRRPCSFSYAKQGCHLNLEFRNESSVYVLVDNSLHYKASLRSKFEKVFDDQSKAEKLKQLMGSRNFCFKNREEIQRTINKSLSLAEIEKISQISGHCHEDLSHKFGPTVILMHDLLKYIAMYWEVFMNVYDLAGEGGNLMIYGLVAAQLSSLLISYEKLQDLVLHTAKQLFKMGDELRDEITNNRKDSPFIKKWQDNYARGRKNFESFCFCLENQAIHCIREIDTQIKDKSVFERFQHAKRLAENFTRNIVFLNQETAWLEGGNCEHLLQQSVGNAPPILQPQMPLTSDHKPFSPYWQRQSSPIEGAVDLENDDIFIAVLRVCCKKNAYVAPFLRVYDPNFSDKIQKDYGNEALHGRRDNIVFVLKLNADDSSLSVLFFSTKNRSFQYFDPCGHSAPSKIVDLLEEESSPFYHAHFKTLEFSTIAPLSKQDKRHCIIESVIALCFNQAVFNSADLEMDKSYYYRIMKDIRRFQKNIRTSSGKELAAWDEETLEKYGQHLNSSNNDFLEFCDFHFCYWKGLQFFEQGDLKNSLRYFTSLISGFSPLRSSDIVSYPHALYYCGLLLKESGKIEKSATCLQYAIKLCVEYNSGIVETLDADEIANICQIEENCRILCSELIPDAIFGQVVSLQMTK